MSRKDSRIVRSGRGVTWGGKTKLLRDVERNFNDVCLDL